MPAQSLTKEFKEISNEKELRGFLEKYEFRLADSRSHPDQYVLGVFIGKIEGRPAKLTHRLFDQPPSASTLQERNQLLLEIGDADAFESGFAGHY
jgi:hypothetical protein